MDETTRLEQRLRTVAGTDDRIAVAVRIARDVHRDEVRDEGTPYIRHPLRVALILVEELGRCNPEIVCAALLHDALETSPDRVQEIRAQLGSRVTELVLALTNDLPDSDLEGKARYLRRFASVDDDCLLVKLCDRLDNLRSLPECPDPAKADRIRSETRTYLMPLLNGRPALPGPLEALLREALEAGAGSGNAGSRGEV